MFSLSASPDLVSGVIVKFLIRNLRSGQQEWIDLPFAEMKDVAALDAYYQERGFKIVEAVDTVFVSI